MRQSEACRSVLKKKFSASEYSMMVHDDGDEGRGDNYDDDMMTMTKYDVWRRAVLYLNCILPLQFRYP